MASQFDMGNLIEGIIWGNVAIAMLIYGKKTENWKAGGAGGVMLILSWLLPWPWLSLASIVLCVMAFKR